MTNFESIKALEIQASVLLILDFANNTILFLFVIFLFLDLKFLISTVIGQIFNPIAELVIFIGIRTKQRDPAFAEITISE